MERLSPACSSATSESKKTKTNRDFLERKDETFLSFFFRNFLYSIVHKWYITLFEGVITP